METSARLEPAALVPTSAQGSCPMEAFAFKTTGQALALGEKSNPTMESLRRRGFQPRWQRQRL